MIKHPVAFIQFVLFIVLVFAPVPCLFADEPLQDDSLHDAFAERFVVGVGLNGNLREDYTDRERELIGRQFAIVTPANCMKMEHIWREPNQYRWEEADAFVEYASANDLQVCGHCLIWAKDDRTPLWVYEDDEGETLDRETMLRRMREYIHEVGGRYRGKVASWDVVNEVLSDGGDVIRPSQWLDLIGEDYIDHAFRYAKEADPDAVLVFNDYNIWMPYKRDKMLSLLQGLLDRGVPIDAVGMQGHWELDRVPFEEVEATIEAIESLGLKVMVTELDLDVVTRSRWWADGGKYREEMSQTDPFRDGCPEDVLQRQAEQYAQLFEIFVRHGDAIDRITFWDLHDGHSWLNKFPWERANYPLLFDSDARSKPAFHAVLETAP